MPPKRKLMGDGNLHIVVKGLDLIRGCRDMGGGEAGTSNGGPLGTSSRGGGGGGEISSGAGGVRSTTDSVRGGEAGRGTGNVGRTRSRGGGDGVESSSGAGPVPTDGTRGQEIFANMRVLIGYSRRSRNQVSKWIVELGGSVLSPMHYQQCTHIYIEGEDIDTGEAHAYRRDKKKLLTKRLIKQAYDTGKMCHDDNDPGCSNQIDAGQSTDFRSGRVKRMLCFNEMEDDIIMSSNHQLFLCKADGSKRFSLIEYVQTMKKTLVTNIITPGSFPPHHSNITNPEVKAVIKEVYVLIKSLNRAGHSLCGEFNSDNFIIDKAKGQFNVRFDGIHTNALKNSDPDNEELDTKGFKKMVRRQIFQNKMVPHDMNLWLFLVGNTECEDLMPQHVYLLDYSQWTEPFMIWYDTWGNLKSSDTKTYYKIMDELRGYKGWKDVVKGNETNTILESTLGAVDPHTKMTVDYSDDAYGLIHLLRNCRHHQGLENLRCFALIASQLFPNLISDLQLAMVKAGVIKPLA